MKNLKYFVTIILFMAGACFSTSYAQQNPPEKHFKNSTEEFKYYYTLANDYSIGEAAFKLGQFYETGYGTKQDLLRAYVYYRYAVLQKVKGADEAYKKLTSKLDTKQIAEAKKLQSEITGNNLDKLINNMQSVE